MKRLTAIHSFLFAVFPILSVFRANLDMVNVRELVLPILIVELATVLLWLLARRFVGEGEAAAVVVSVFWLLFFSYAALRDGLGLGHGLLPVIVLAALCLLVAYEVKRQRSRMHNPALIMTAVGLALVLMPTLSVAPALVRRQQAPVTVPNVEAAPVAAGERPDIYYIILDGYARGDVLEEIYEYDNSPFLDGLASRGFYVAQQSTANYAQTYLSLASSLNLCYLDDLARRVGLDSDDRRPLGEMVRENAVVRFLRQQGYTYVMVSTGYFGAELTHADVHIAARWSCSVLDQGLINISPLSCLSGLQYDMHRESLLYALEHLQDATEVAGPVFVFAHILAPHSPFVFTDDGGNATPDEPFSLRDGTDGPRTSDGSAYADGYTGQLSFVNVKVLAAIDAIIAKSSRPPVIILQADHGSALMLDWTSAERTNMKERMSILNAYYLRGGERDGLYPEITPVNTFRLIFNEYLGADYGMLKDESYFSLYDRPYGFILVPAS